jgi:cell division protein FtsB
MERILDRIEKTAKNEGIKIAYLEKTIGASKGVLSRAINNKTDIQAKWIQSIVENYPLYSESWLLTGRGEMLKANTTVINVEEKKPTPAPVSEPGEATALYSMFMERCENLARESGQLKAENGRLNTENEQLKNENEQLKSQNGELKAKNEELKTENEKLKAGTEKFKKQKLRSYTDINMVPPKMTVAEQAEEYVPLINK